MLIVCSLFPSFCRRPLRTRTRTRTHTRVTTLTPQGQARRVGQGVAAECRGGVPSAAHAPLRQARGRPVLLRRDVWRSQAVGLQGTDGSVGDDEPMSRRR